MSPSSTTARGASRVVGIDVARCVALLGMMAVHVLPAYTETGELSQAYVWASGRSSALFAVLAGVSVALTSGRARPLAGRALGGATAALVARAVLITAVGLALGELESGVAVILTYYGVFFLLALPFLRLRSGALFAVAVPWLLLAPVVSQLVRPELPAPDLLNPTLGSLGDPGALLAELTFTGYYPGVTWLGYVLLGMALGRLDLRSRTLPLTLALVGAGAAMMASATSDLLLRRPGAVELLELRFGTVGDARAFLPTSFSGTTPYGDWWWLAVASPHSGTPLDLLGTAGSASVVLGLALLVGRAAPRVAEVVGGAGAMTLTLYSAHVVLKATLWDDQDGSTYLLHAASALTVGALFALARRRGPLEAVVARASRAARRAVDRPAAPSSVS